MRRVAVERQGIVCSAYSCSEFAHGRMVSPFERAGFFDGKRFAVAFVCFATVGDSPVPFGLINMSVENLIKDIA